MNLRFRISSCLHHITYCWVGNICHWDLESTGQGTVLKCGDINDFSGWKEWQQKVKKLESVWIYCTIYSSQYFQLNSKRTMWQCTQPEEILWNKPRKESSVCTVSRQILVQVKPVRTQAFIHAVKVRHGAFCIQWKWEVRKGFEYFNVIILKLLKCIVSSESKPDAFMGDGATVMLWVGPPLQDIFS